ncbi:MAG: ThuA domain-containing protein [Bacteroidota bacterium]
MKAFHYLFVCIIIFVCYSCQSKTEVVETDSQIKQWLTFEGKADRAKIVLISGDEEYRSEEALPQLAKILSTRHGFNCTVLFAQDPEKPGIINPNYVHNIPGLENLKTADLMVIFTRFRALPNEQMQYIDDYLKSGKPVIGIRTATHAFNFSKIDSTSKWKHYSNYYDGNDEWNEGFGRLILGEKWISHHGNHKHQSTRGVAAPGMDKHPILNGISQGDIWAPTDVYGVRLPLPSDSQPIVLGQVINRIGEYNEQDSLYGMRFTDNDVAGIEIEKDKDGKEIKINRNEPMMPVAWTKSYQLPDGQKGNVFTTTLGAATDLLTEGTRRMIINSVFWCLDLTVPEKTNVDLIGDYRPSPFAFKEDQYWSDQNLSVSSQQ